MLWAAIRPNGGTERVALSGEQDERPPEIDEINPVLDSPNVCRPQANTGLDLGHS
jgi:hypothetical protein